MMFSIVSKPLRLFPALMLLVPYYSGAVDLPTPHSMIVKQQKQAADSLMKEIVSQYHDQDHQHRVLVDGTTDFCAAVNTAEQEQVWESSGFNFGDISCTCTDNGASGFVIRCSISSFCCGGVCYTASYSVDTQFGDSSFLLKQEICSGFVSGAGALDGKTRCISYETEDGTTLQNCAASVNGSPCESCTICRDLTLPSLPSFEFDVVTAQCSNFQLAGDPYALQCGELQAIFDDTTSTGGAPAVENNGPTNYCDPRVSTGGFSGGGGGGGTGGNNSAAASTQSFALMMIACTMVQAGTWMVSW